MAGPFTTPVAISVPFLGVETSEGVAVVPPFISKNVRDGIIEARETAQGTQARYAISTGKTGNVKNAWLEFFDSIPSNLVPFIAAEGGLIKAISISNQLAVANGVIEFYKNGALAHTLNWSGKTSFVNGLNISVTAGDEFSVYIGGKQLKDPIYCLFVQVYST